MTMRRTATGLSSTKVWRGNGSFGFRRDRFGRSSRPFRAR